MKETSATSKVNGKKQQNKSEVESTPEFLEFIKQFDCEETFTMLPLDE